MPLDDGARPDETHEVSQGSCLRGRFGRIAPRLRFSVSPAELFRNRLWYPERPYVVDNRARYPSGDQIVLGFQQNEGLWHPTHLGKHHEISLETRFEVHHCSLAYGHLVLERCGSAFSTCQ